MNLRPINLSIALALLLISCASSATVVLEKYHGTSEVTIKIEDEIFTKDLQDFKDALQQVEDYQSVLHMNAVQLNSRGGSGTTAKEIGKILRSRKLNTYLAPGHECASACVDILIAGAIRYAFGEVAVHRATYSGEIPSTDRIAVDIEGWMTASSEYIASMGISRMLSDAIQSTPSWQLRTLTPAEVRQWGLLGIDQQTEEELFTQIAKERFISRKEFIDIYKQNYDECLNQAKGFNTTVFECAKSRKIKNVTWYERLAERFTDWIATLNTKSIFQKSHTDTVKQIYKDIRSKDTYLRYMDIVKINTTKYVNTEASLQPLAEDDVLAMEAKNKWWVNRNNISIVLANPTRKNIKKVVFSLSTTDCQHDGKKQYMVLELLEPLDGYRSVVYSGPLPFDYVKEFGEGERCGVVEQAF